jgi:hypothetical protein
MRKIVEHIIGIIVVILSTGGCMSETMTTKIPVNIGFRPVIGHDTRADESIPFPQDRTFSAWAVNNFDQSIYINNETIACNGGEWKSKYVWPEESLRFSAFYPQDVPHAFSSERGVMINEYSTADGGRDLLVASTVAGGDEATDSLVNLRFDHILSRIEFRMQHSLSTESSDGKIKIIKCTFYAGDISSCLEKLHRILQRSKMTEDIAGIIPVELSILTQYFPEGNIISHLNFGSEILL